SQRGLNIPGRATGPLPVDRIIAPGSRRPWGFGDERGTRDTPARAAPARARRASQGVGARTPNLLYPTRVTGYTPAPPRTGGQAGSFLAPIRAGTSSRLA